MVSRRKITEPNDPAPRPVDSERPGQPGEGQPAEAVPGEGTEPTAVTVKVAVNEPPAKPVRRRARSRRTTMANSVAEPAPHATSAGGGSGPAGTGHAELLRAVYDSSQGHWTHAERVSREFTEM
jgi:hypothetical protein